MSIRLRSRRGISVVVVGVLLLVAATPVLGLPTIPERELVPTGGERQTIHVRIQTGCEQAATDRIEVEIPPEVLAVVPEAVQGWTTETEVIETEPYEVFGDERSDRIAVVRWVGGSVPATEFADFGITALFRDPPPELAFPVTQSCGDQVLEWTQVAEEGQEPSDLDFPAPVLTIASPAPSVDVEALETTLGELQTQVEDLRVPALRDRVDQLETRIEEMETRITDLEARIAELEGG
jgi:uncharacterized protein YcnI